VHIGALDGVSLCFVQGLAALTTAPNFAPWEVTQMSEYGEIELLVDRRMGQEDEDRARAARLDEARRKVDEARLAIAQLAGPAVAIIACRLMGHTADWDGAAVTDERVETAMSVLDRVGIPKLRATAIAASIAHAPTSAAPGSPGWESPQVDAGGEAEELDVGSVDAQIAAFLDGARIARDVDGK
jgi:hypothetical protein